MPVIAYMEQQIQRALAACQLADNDLVGLMSGRGGAQVDLVLYLISQGECSDPRKFELSDIA